MATVYLDNNIEQKEGIDILYDAYEKRYIKFASIQINKIIAMLKKQFKYDYTVSIISSLEHTNFKYIDRTNSESEYETVTDGYISSGKVFFYKCEESDTQEERFRRLSRVCGNRVRIIIKENCLYNIDPLYKSIMNLKTTSCKLYKVSTINDQLFESKEYFKVIENLDDKEILVINDVSLIEFGLFSSRFTGLTNMGKNKNFDKESIEELKEMKMFHEDEFTKSLIA